MVQGHRYEQAAATFCVQCLLLSALYTRSIVLLLLLFLGVCQQHHIIESPLLLIKRLVTVIKLARLLIF